MMADKHNVRKARRMATITRWLFSRETNLVSLSTVLPVQQNAMIKVATIARETSSEIIICRNFDVG